MSSPSNLYAEKVFAEHPSALYALDDVANYISLIEETDRNVSLWDLDNATASLDTNVVDEPFINSHTTRIFGDLPTEEALTISAISSEIVNLANLNQDLGTFSVGGYFYTESAYLSKISIGYEYTDSETSNIIQNVKDFSVNIAGAWMFISETFNIPDFVEEDIRIVFKIEYIEGGTESDYEFLVNGITAGQWAEEFQSSSLGSDVISIPEDIAIDTANGVRAEAYGLQDLPGYYLVEDNALLAKNTGMPMVYGASNITKISAAINNEPSLIIPGLGFLNNSGKYKDYTFEFWLRIDAETPEPKRIVGPISSTDGLYVDGSFLKLKINDYIGSHYVGEWYRPMLVQIRYINNNVTLLINGEEVIFLEVLTDTLSFPEKYNNQDQDQDWLGFYSHENIYQYEIDCVAIYSYQSPAVVAKRRWVYGQGVEYPENINQSYSGESVFVDYSFANYANNYNYPDIGKWDNGISDNMLTNEIFMGTPEYRLPTVAFDNRNYEDWLESLSLAQESETKITLCPDEEWEDTNGHILFSNLNFLKEDVAAFYVVLKEGEFSKETYQVLFSIKDKRSNNFLEAVLLDGEITYSLDYEGRLQTLKTNSTIDTTEKFVVGLNFKDLSRHFGSDVSAFLGRLDSLSLYIGGSFNFIDGFLGDIYSINFLNSRNVSTAAFPNFSVFTDGIILTDNNVTNFEVNRPSYRLKLKNIFDSYKLSIDTYSYWQDYLPLSYFGKYVDNYEQEKTYTLDFLQFNIDSPATSTIVLDEYSTLNNPVTVYATFSYVSQGINKDISEYTTTKFLSSTNILEPDENWETTKYEIVDGTVIYLPKNINFNNLAISIHIEAYSQNAETDKIKIRRIQLASQALSETGSNAVNTRFGNPLYPYTKTGYYFDYKSKNPFKIYKDTSPYLYLTKSSGIKVLGNQQASVNRGLSIPLNKNLSADYKVIAIQTGIYYDQQSFPSTPTQIMEVQGRTSYIKFFAESIDPYGRRAKIYAVNANTGAYQNNVAFFWNGKLVKNAIITAKEWGMLGISFGQQLILNSAVGAIRLTGKDFVFNNVSHYKSTNLQEVQQISNRTWQRVKTLNLIDLDWSYWYPAFTWNQVLVTLPSIFFGIDPSDIYATFTGTNKVIVDDERALMVKDYEYNSYNNIISEIQVISAA